MLLLTLFATFLPATFAVKCYVCSWSPKDAANRTTICTDEYFEANGVVISECENGCETYTHWDSFGSVEHMRRNCLHDTVVTAECQSEKGAIHTARRCTCNYDLCNSASILKISSVVPTLILCIFLILHLYNI